MKDIELDIKNIFSKYVNINFEDEKLKEQNLFLNPINIYPIYLAAILIDIEKFYGINFEDEDILNGKFCSFNNITQLILKMLIRGRR